MGRESIDIDIIVGSGHGHEVLHLDRIESESGIPIGKEGRIENDGQRRNVGRSGNVDGMREEMTVPVKSTEEGAITTDEIQVPATETVNETETETETAIEIAEDTSIPHDETSIPNKYHSHIPLIRHTRLRNAYLSILCSYTHPMLLYSMLLSYAPNIPNNTIIPTTL